MQTRSYGSMFILTLVGLVGELSSFRQMSTSHGVLFGYCRLNPCSWLSQGGLWEWASGCLDMQILVEQVWSVERRRKVIIFDKKIINVSTSQSKDTGKWRLSEPASNSFVGGGSTRRFDFELMESNQGHLAILYNEPFMSCSHYLIYHNILIFTQFTLVYHDNISMYVPVLLSNWYLSHQISRVQVC